MCAVSGQCVMELVHRAVQIVSVLLIYTVMSQRQSIADGREHLTNRLSTPTESEVVIRKDVEEVGVLFTASKNGKFVSDLRAGDVIIRDDKKPPAALLGFYNQQELPLRLGLLVDLSGSVDPRFGFEQAAVGTFVTQVLRPSQDVAFVMGFSDSLVTTQEFTNHAGMLWRGIMAMENNGRHTALFDAIIAACQKLIDHPENQFVARTLVVVSDGDDNVSDATLHDAIVTAQHAEVTIYAIGINEEGSRYGTLQGADNLKQLAEKTGGRAFVPRTVDKLRSELAHTIDELRSRYAICYRPADFTFDGHYRSIRIFAQQAGKKLKVRSRKGYYAVPINPQLVKYNAPLLGGP